MARRARPSEAPTSWRRSVKSAGRSPKLPKRSRPTAASTTSGPRESAVFRIESCSPGSAATSSFSRTCAASRATGRTDSREPTRSATLDRDGARASGADARRRARVRPASACVVGGALSRSREGTRLWPGCGLLSGLLALPGGPLRQGGVERRRACSAITSRPVPGRSAALLRALLPRFQIGAWKRASLRRRGRGASVRIRRRRADVVGPFRSRRACGWSRHPIRRGATLGSLRLALEARRRGISGAPSSISIDVSRRRLVPHDLVDRRSAAAAAVLALLIAHERGAGIPLLSSACSKKVLLRQNGES